MAGWWWRPTAEALLPRIVGAEGPRPRAGRVDDEPCGPASAVGLHHQPAMRILIGAPHGEVVLVFVCAEVGRKNVAARLERIGRRHGVARQLVEGIGERKISVIGLPGALSAGEYEALGVARISYGPMTQRVALTALQDVASDLYADGVIPASTRALN